MKDINGDNAGLTASEIRKFKALLREKRNEILGNVHSMEDETLRRRESDSSNMQAHMADAGSDNYEIENTLGLMDSERKILREIDEALDRIEEGTYGICEGSGKLIPKARLEAIPWTKYCVEYASSLEKGSVRRNMRSFSLNFDYGDDEQDDNSTDAYRRAAI